MTTKHPEVLEIQSPPGRRLTLAALLLAAGVAAFFNGLNGAFLYDGLDAIVNNPHIRHLWPLSDAMSLPLWNSGFTVDGRPILSLSFALNLAILGPSAAGFHAVNVAIHVAAALLLFSLIRQTLCLPQFQARYGKRADWIAGATALLWMIHPLQTESVTYVVQRAESLAGLLYLATLSCALRGIRSQRIWPWFPLSVFWCALGVGTKEVVATAPLALLMYDAIFLTGSFKASLRKHWPLYVSLITTWIVAVWTIFGTWGDKEKSATLFTPLSYAASQPLAILYYLRLSFWPHPLVLHYRWPLHTPFLEILIPGLIVLALLGPVAWGIWRRRWFGFVGGWFFLVLAPTSSIMPLLQRLQEHRMYLALASVVLVVVLAMDELFERAARRWGARIASAVAVTALLLVASALGIRTHVRNDDYSSELRIWSSNVHYRPQSEIAQLNLGATLVEQGDYKGAVEHLVKAISLAPGFEAGYNNLGVAMLYLGHLPQAEACYKKTLEINPRYLAAHMNLLRLYLQRGEREKALRQCKLILQVDPNVTVVRRAMDALLHQQASF